MLTWRTAIKNEMKSHKESFSDLIASTFKEGEIDVEFDDGWGGKNGIAFTLWTTNRVYFPVCYDGAEWCGSVARHPCYKRTKHQGGG